MQDAIWERIGPADDGLAGRWAALLEEADACGSPKALRAAMGPELAHDVGQELTQYELVVFGELPICTLRCITSKGLKRFVGDDSKFD